MHLPNISSPRGPFDPCARSSPYMQLYPTRVIGDDFIIFRPEMQGKSAGCGDSNCVGCRRLRRRHPTQFNRFRHNVAVASPLRTQTSPLPPADRGHRNLGRSTGCRFPKVATPQDDIAACAWLRQSPPGTLADRRSEAPRRAFSPSRTESSCGIPPLSCATCRAQTPATAHRRSA